MPGRMLSIVLLPALLLSAGCGPFAFTPKRPPTLDGVHAYDQDALDKDILAYEKEGADDATRTGIRTKVVMKIAASIDADYEGFANHFFVDQAWTDTALDIAIIGVGSAGALTGGEAFKAIMSATSAGIAGSRASVSKNFFKEKSPEVVRARMAALRAKQWALIYHKLPAPDSQYSLYEAGRDLIVYYKRAPCGPPSTTSPPSPGTR